MSFKKLGLMASIALCAFPVGAHAGHIETVDWYNQYLPTISTLSVNELNAVDPVTKRSHRDSIRERMFTVFNGNPLPLTGDDFVKTTNESDSVCAVATSVVENLRDNFRVNTVKYSDSKWTSKSWLTSLSQQTLIACSELRSASADFLEYRRVYDANPAKYDRLGYIPKLIDARDLVVSASYTDAQAWEELKVAMREAE